LQLQHVTRRALLALHIVQDRYVRRMQHASSARQQQHDVNTVEWITASDMIDAGKSIVVMRPRCYSFWIDDLGGAGSLEEINVKGESQITGG
jgi:hypothetical protein